VSAARNVVLFGATGTIGRVVLAALLRRGYRVVCAARPSPVSSDREAHVSIAGAARRSAAESRVRAELPAAAELREGDVLEPDSLGRDVFRGESFDAVVSCMASRTGTPADAWAVDHDAHINVLEAARASGVRHFVLLSAICVQKPRLEFQRAKLAFERALVDSGLDWSIVRPTAYFKSVSGQAARVKAGKPFLVFGDGTLTACKPIGNEDLAEYLVDCLEDPQRRNRILPLGGPGPALTARQQGALLAGAAGVEPRFLEIPVALLHAVAGTLGTLARVFPPLAAKAELARIARYYATESMLVWDAEAERYDADATPEFGTRTLADHYRDLVRGAMPDERGDHAVF